MFRKVENLNRKAEDIYVDRYLFNQPRKSVVTECDVFKLYAH